MGQLFYDHLVSIDSLYSEIETLNLSGPEKVDIIACVEDTLHHRVIHLILDELDPNHHQYFLEIFHHQPYHSSILVFIKTKIIDIETKIKNVAEEVKYEALTIVRRYS